MVDTRGSIWYVEKNYISPWYERAHIFKCLPLFIKWDMMLYTTFIKIKIGDNHIALEKKISKTHGQMKIKLPCGYGARKSNPSFERNLEHTAF